MNTTLVSTPLLQAIAALAQTAARAIMQVYASGFAVEAKSDTTPITAADRRSHDVIVAGLRRLTPTVPVLSEESPEEVHEYAQRRTWHRLWLVDPLDGTREFVARNGEFTVNIALIEEHAAVMGAVGVPATGTVYFGAHELGASKQLQGETPVPLRPRVPADLQPLVLCSRSHGDPALDGALESLGPHTREAVGSALKFCRVAEGTADFYPRFGATSEWDTAAGQAVLESAGGQVIDALGEPLRYNARPTLTNPGFLAFADAARDWHAVWAARGGRLQEVC